MTTQLLLENWDPRPPASFCQTDFFKGIRQLNLSTVYALRRFTLCSVILVPPLIFILSPALQPADWRRVLHGLIGVTVVMAVVAWSQVIWGWRLEDNAIVTDVKRAQVFYSHPLTLAYVGLLIFPAGFLRWLRSPREPWDLGLFLASSSLVITSRSRTAQAVCLLLVSVGIFTKLKGRLRVTVVGVGLTMVLGIGLTPNPISKRFREVLTREDTRSDYPDDRLAFWHAHWLMFQEKLLLGHGDHLNTAYRKPYYARLGMVDFIRTYEAHNMYIQVAVNAGLLGLIVFLAATSMFPGPPRVPSSSAPPYGSPPWTWGPRQRPDL